MLKATSWSGEWSWGQVAEEEWGDVGSEPRQSWQSLRIWHTKPKDLGRRERKVWEPQWWAGWCTSVPAREQQGCARQARHYVRELQEGRERALSPASALSPEAGAVSQQKPVFSSPSYSGHFFFSLTFFSRARSFRCLLVLALLTPSLKWCPLARPSPTLPCLSVFHYSIHYYLTGGI